MGRNRFVKVETDRIPLSDGDWIEVKKDLDTGDSKKLEAAGVDPPMRIKSELNPMGEIYSPINWERYEIERAFICLTDWSLKGEDDKPVKLTIAALKALDPVDFKEISDAIVEHMVSRTKEKNALRVAAMKNSQPPTSEESDQTSTS